MVSPKNHIQSLFAMSGSVALAVCLAMAASSAVLAAPSGNLHSKCSAVAGLTAWSDANFMGASYQYSVAWNTCTSMAAQFPYEQPAGVSSIAANPGNWCTVYPNTDCNPGQGRGNDTLDVVSSYYDLADPEEAWDNLPQSFSCRQFNC